MNTFSFDTKTSSFYNLFIERGKIIAIINEWGD
jgi:hypothetical protein